MMKRMQMKRLIGWLASLIAVVTCVLLPAIAYGADVAHTDTLGGRWYVVQLGGHRAGWAHEAQSEAGDGTTTSTSELNISIERMGRTITIAVRTTFEETADGLPIRMSSVQDMAIMTVLDEYVFDRDHVTHTSTQAGRTTKRIEPTPDGKWMTPAKAADYVEMKMEAGANKIMYTTLDPSSGLKPVTNTIEIVGPTKIEVVGKTVPAIEWKVSQSVMPGITSREFVDAEGRTLKSVFSFGGIEMVMLEADKEFALSKVEAPELMAQTLVTPSRPIEHARKLRRAEYVLSIPEGDSIASLNTGGAQHVERIDDRHIRVVVDLDTVQRASEQSISDARYLDSSTNADGEDPKIVEIVEQALDGAGDEPRAQAEALRRFVHGYIEEKSLGVGFATASEVCRTQEGDCSEHGVLLAAMLRTAGIPSRVVSGVIYVDRFAGAEGVFGYHMWTQALLEVDGAKRWVDFDATLPDGTSFDAAHIAMSTSSLADGDVINSMAALVNLLGRVEIEVVSAEVGEAVK